MTPDRARLRKLLADAEGVASSLDRLAELVCALPALLDALDEAEKALRRIVSHREHALQDTCNVYCVRELKTTAREALARMGEKP